MFTFDKRFRNGEQVVEIGKIDANVFMHLCFLNKQEFANFASVVSEVNEKAFAGSLRWTVEVPSKLEKAISTINDLVEEKAITVKDLAKPKQVQMAKGDNKNPVPFVKNYEI